MLNYLNTCGYSTPTPSESAAVDLIRGCCDIRGRRPVARTVSRCNATLPRALHSIIRTAAVLCRGPLLTMTFVHSVFVWPRARQQVHSNLPDLLKNQAVVTDCLKGLICSPEVLRGILKFHKSKPIKRPTQIAQHHP